MKKVLVIKKKEGETPLEALEVFRRKHPAYRNLPMTYAGRLDPMASGLLLVLSGDECKNKDKYLKLDKEYEFEILFGFSTDTYDILGLVHNHSDILQNDKMLKNNIEKNLKFFKGKYLQKYPVYSSKTVAGKQLWQYGREGVDVEMPAHQVEVKYLKLVRMRTISAKMLLQKVEERIKKVKGDFRQDKIVQTWQKELAGSTKRFNLASFKIKCSSGTYVRSIAYALGEHMSVPALAYSIKRTKIHKYSISKSQ